MSEIVLTAKGRRTEAELMAAQAKVIAPILAKWSDRDLGELTRQIEQRSWHLYWINSYGQPPLGMKGLDATVDEEAGLDLQFVNNTDNYLLIQSRVEGTNLVFGLYGTRPSWDVKIDGPSITNVRPADTAVVQQAEPSMPVGKTLAVEAAQDGFDTAITRTVSLGDNVRTLRLTSKYIPSRNVVLNGTGGA